MGFRSDTEILRRKRDGLRKEHQVAKRETEREEREITKLAESLGVGDEIPSAREGRAFATTLSLVLCLPLLVLSVVAVRAYTMPEFPEQPVVSSHTLRFDATLRNEPSRDCQLELRLDGAETEHIALRCGGVELYRQRGDGDACRAGSPVLSDRLLHYQLHCYFASRRTTNELWLSFGSYNLKVSALSQATDVQFEPFPEGFYLDDYLDPRLPWDE